ncbi:MAG: protoheme IX farnesyltransferase [Candidatus Marinimicrobia bacterium]|nr:protoheme IX farnesyltransferase [Candidatus Neomarinimicrobiota bacterium]
MKKILIDFIKLTKPKLLLLVLITTVSGFYLGSEGILDTRLMIITLIGTTFVAAGALVLNQYIERDIDAIMKRTKNRPLPDGRLEAKSALIFGLTLAMAGLFINFVFVNTLTGTLAVISMVSYLLVYTPMKTKSAFCIVIGAVPGALPVAGGWVAASGSFDQGALILFAILFFWQIPHSLAIAWLYKSDYEKAGMRLLPDSYPGDNATGHQVLINTTALLPIGLMPSILGMTGHLHFFAALMLGAIFALYAAKFAMNQSVPSAKKLLYASYLYIPFQLGIMSFDRISY